MTVDINTNTVYVSESGNHRISSFNSQGNFIACFGSGGDKDNQFNNSCGLAVDMCGLLHICDNGNDHMVSYGQVFKKPWLLV